MANTAAICTSFKQELPNGIHALGTSVVRASTAADVFKAALFIATATLSAATAAYSTTNEVTGAGYTAGGVAVAWVAPAATGTVVFTNPTADIAYGTCTFATSFDACLIYNSTQGNKALGVYTFPAQTVNAAPFSLSVPVNDSTHALLRIA
jgi:hypothetical protein